MNRVLVLLILYSTFCGFTLTDGVEEKLAFTQDLKRDILKVQHSIEVTRELIDRSTDQAYLPDVMLRLAELHVEKSRLVHFLKVEAEGKEAARRSTESEFLKHEAINIYSELVRRYPGYRDNDKVLFFMAHEYNELGMHAEMLSTYRKLIDEYPRSRLLLEATYLVGDHLFNTDHLDEAEDVLRKILKYPETPVHDRARYKLAWIEINRARSHPGHWKKALRLFEEVATSKNDSSGDLRLQAISGLVFCFTEVLPAKQALDFFRKLSDSKITYVYALEKLATRYFIKEQFQNAPRIYRRLIELTGDAEKNTDYAQRIYDASLHARNREKADQDVEALGRAASGYLLSWRIPDAFKKQLRDELETYARDIATKLHLLARKRRERHAYRATARTYRSYLDHFDPGDKRNEILSNYGEALFHSGRFLQAGRVYEELAMDREDQEQKDYLYSAIQAYQRALGEKKHLSRAERVETRQAILQLGSYFVKNFRKDPHVPTIQFNVARMLFERGRYRQAADSFLAFLKENPQHPEAAVAAHLALDCHYRLRDPQGLIRTGRSILAEPGIQSESLRKDIQARMEQARTHRVKDRILASLEQGQDPVESLLQPPDNQDDEQSEDFLYEAVILARKNRDVKHAFEAGGRLAKLHPDSSRLPGVYITLSSFAVEMADYELAADLFEEFSGRFPHHRQAREALLKAARTHARLGRLERAAGEYRKLLGGATGEQRGRLLLEVANMHAQGKKWPAAHDAAKQAIAAWPSSPRAHLLWARALANLKRIEEAQQAFLTAAAIAGPEEASLAAEAQFRLAELILGQFRELSFSGAESTTGILDRKVEMLSALERIYTEVIRTQDPHWAMGALYRLSVACEEFAGFLQAVPVVGVSEKERSQVQKTLAEQSRSQRETAANYRAACIQTASEKSLFGPFVQACLTGQEPDIDRIPRSGRKTADHRTAALRSRLAKQPNDRQTLVDLAGLYVQQADFQIALMILDRALDIDASYAPALNLRGVVELHLGEDQHAYRDFKKASEIVSDYLPARLNLAGLYVSYQNEERARRVLKSLHDRVRAVDLSAPEIHPCVKTALNRLRIH